MLVLKILLVALGMAFLLFGYFIFFRKQYQLINGFVEDQKAGRKDADYARRVGMVEFVVGIGLLVVAALLILLG